MCREIKKSETNNKFRRLKNDEVYEGYQVICDAVFWLLSKGIKQWPRPIPFRLYEKWHRRGYNYGSFSGGEISLVLTAIPMNPPLWKSYLPDEPVTWLRMITLASPLHHEGLGKILLFDALRFFKEAGVKEVFLECACENEFLPNFYSFLGFEQVARGKKKCLAGIFDTALFRKQL